MSKSLYYGEIVAKISYHLYQNPEHKTQISQVMGRESEDEDKVHTLCADAARVFDTLEDLAGEHFIDWSKALDCFADEILDHLLNGKIPQIMDLIFIASGCIHEAY
ncbi:MAG: hypothetical protein ABJF04_16140 [Reichenbachiella sp.]|uniref:hypothetical protein n=1 Tax=Reichenbachiella sp. TaxID=2184521 RepID=UPI0032645A92